MALVCSTLVFDLDGTISDPSLGICRCFNYALRKQGYAEVPSEAVAALIGPPLDTSFRALVPSISDAGVAELVASYRERYADAGYAENTLYSGIPEVLLQLQEAGLRLGICTSKRADFAEQILGMFGLSNFFEFVSGGDIGISKASQLADPLANGDIDDQAVMVGDRAIDITSAADNGLRAIGVLWGFGDFTELSEASPALILERIDELACVIGQSDD